MGDVGLVIKNRFRLLKVIGKGGWGVVYKGMDEWTAGTVAVKQVKTAGIPQDELKGMMNEITLLQKLKNENIVRYIDSHITEGAFFIVLEFLENGSLSDMLKDFGEGGNFPEHLIVLYITQVLRGLDYLHRQGVIHRDIKAANILSTKEGVIKVADFGVATNDSEKETVIGTPYWMAPEIIELHGASTKSDIWSLGCTIIELLSGKPPYYDLDQMQALFKIVQDDMPPLPEGISPLCKDFLMQCFQKEPLLRQSAEVLLKHRWITTNARKKAVDLDVDAKQYNQMRMEKQQEMIETRKEQAAQRKPEKSKTRKHHPKESKTKKAEDKKKKEKRDGKRKGGKHHKSKHHHGQKKKKKDAAPTALVSEIKVTDDSWSDETPALEALKSQQPLTFETSDSSAKFKQDAGSDSFSDSFNMDDITAAVSELSTLTFEVKQIDDSGDSFSDFSDEDDALPVFLVGSDNGKNVDKKELKVETFVLKKEDDEEDDDIEFSGDSGEELQLKFQARFNEDEEVADSDTEDPFEDMFSDESEAEDDIRETIDQALVRNHLQEVSDKVDKKIDIVLRSELENVDVVLEACHYLVNTFREYPEQKERLVKKQGVIPILEMLQIENEQVLHSVLQVVTEIIEHQKEIQEGVQVMGAIPAIIRFWGPKRNSEGFYSPQVRKETVRFLKKMMETLGKNFFLRNFISNQALPALKGLLEPTTEFKPNKQGVSEAQYDYQANRGVCLWGIDLIHTILHINLGLAKKNDFCRLWARGGVLPPLVRCLGKILKHETGDDKEKYVNLISEIFLVFGRSDVVVRRLFVQKEVLLDLFQMFDDLPSKSLLNVLKAIKDISQEPTTLDAFQQAGAIPRIVSLMNRRRNNPEITSAPLYQYLLQIAFQFCRLVPDRQKEAAKHGMIDHLKAVIDENSTSKQFALPILFEIAHCPQVIPYLWENDMVEYYVKLLRQGYPWQIQAVESITTWLASEPQRVLERLPTTKNCEELRDVFSSAQGEGFVALVNPFQKLLNHQILAREMYTVGFLPVLLERIKHHDALVRVTILKMLISMYEHNRKSARKAMVKDYALRDLVNELAEDSAILVVEMATQLKEKFD
eukprot:TRINITY_DN7566_c1_g1_i1.p1 TRINITY_DN7566_c1_g1~~TRINITY_DN7566_c1_g1_i1.p1  ORF type:complete len:1094 (-),score=247.61 TRINITY_DN7566_c1_g1_i1:58-3339(-)